MSWITGEGSSFTNATRAGLALAAVCAGMLAPSTPALADFGVAKFEAGTCNTDTLVEECSYTAPESQFYTQAAGHPPIGLTGFEVNTEATLGGKKPIGAVKDVRVDIPPGLSVNPQATCSSEELETNTCAGKGQCTKEQFEKSLCPPESIVGSDELDAFLAALEVDHISVPMYNLVPPEGVPAEFGLEINVAKLLEVKILIVGGLSWFKEAPTSENSGVPTGDYHEYFKIQEVPTTVGLIKTRLKFTGTAGDGTFITLPSVCSTQTSYLHVDPYGEHSGEFLGYQTLSGFPPKAISVSGCEEIPFAPSQSLTAGKSEEAPDQPDGVTVDLHVPQSKSASQLNSSDLSDAHVTLPEGLTMNPSAAHDLQACSQQQIGLGSDQPVGCPAASKIGSVSIETPVLPPKSLQGTLYLGDPSGATIAGPPFTVYLVAESPRYGVGVRLQGLVEPDPNTGQLTATFSANPQLPFEDVVLKLNGGARAPLANPLVCVPSPLSELRPYSGQPAVSAALISPFSAGLGSVCPTSAPFALSQATNSQPSGAAVHSSYDFTLARSDGQQYLSKILTTLPPGLVGAIPSVPLCHEPQAANGDCPAASQIGTARVAAGSGGEPYVFSGAAFLTGPYNGAPYGLSIAVPAAAGPFDFGAVVTRAGVSVDPYSARVVVSSALPTIVKGVPLRLRSIDVNVNRPKFLFNPTSCASLSTDTTLTSTFGATQSLSSRFQASGCSTLPFAPKLSASTKAKTTRAIGAALKTKIVFPKGMQANVKSVLVELPKQLPARISTLNLACREATFAANPLSCPPGAYAGTATVSTPVLPDPLTGPAVLVSHGGAAFPDLDLILSGDGVSVILVGHTNIVKNVTSSDFASLPDVPVSSVEVKLPQGRKSALGAVGDLCKRRLLMPTTITGQNGKVIRQKTRIAVAGCPRKHKHKQKHSHRRRRSHH